MSSAVCQGLQSCLEPWPNMTATSPYFTRSLSFTWGAIVSDTDSGKDLKEKINNNNEKEHNNSGNKDQKNDCDIDNRKKNDSRSSGGDMKGWSFLQALANTIEGPKAAEAEKEKLYIHPLVKRRSMKLSERSLEMCTENLGSETGSVISEEDIIIKPFDCDNKRKSSPTRREQPNSSSSSLMRKVSGVNSREFPPPLTTIRWSNQVKVKSHREGGRLLMKAVTVPCPQSYFQAERGDGHLRLHLLTNYSQRSDPGFDSQAITAQEGEADSEEEEAEIEGEDEAEGEIEGEELDIQEDDKEEEKEVAEEEEEDDVKYMGTGGTNGNNNNNNSNNVNVGGDQVEMGNYEKGRRRRRRSRCSEGDGHRNKLLLIQEPCCWVATS